MLMNWEFVLTHGGNVALIPFTAIIMFIAIGAHGGHSLGRGGDHKWRR